MPLGLLSLYKYFSYNYLIHLALVALLSYNMVNLYFHDFISFSSYVLLPSFLIHFRLIVSFETLFSTLLESYSVFYNYYFPSHFIIMSSCVNLIHILVSIIVHFGSIYLFSPFSALFIKFFLALFGSFLLCLILFGSLSVLFGSFRSFSALFFGPFR